MARWTYMLRWVRCGKAKCHCANAKSKGHGPYWYAAQHTKDGVKWRYIGKAPEHAFDADEEKPDEAAALDPRWTYEGRMNEKIALRIMGFLRWPNALVDLKKRWRILVRDHHPDAGGDGTICAVINAAYTYARRSVYANQ